MKHLSIALFLFLASSLAAQETELFVEVSGTKNFTNGGVSYTYSDGVTFNWNADTEQWTFTNGVDLLETITATGATNFYENWAGANVIIAPDPTTGAYVYTHSGFGDAFTYSLGVFEGIPPEEGCRPAEFFATRFFGDVTTCNLGPDVTIDILGRTSQGVTVTVEEGIELAAQDFLLQFEIQDAYSEHDIGDCVFEYDSHIQEIDVIIRGPGGLQLESHNFQAEYLPRTHVPYTNIYDKFEILDADCNPDKDIWRAKGYIPNPESSVVTLSFYISYENGAFEVHSETLLPGTGVDYQIEKELEYTLEIRFSSADANRPVTVTKTVKSFDYEPVTYYRILDNGGWEAETAIAQQDGLDGIYVADHLKDMESNEQNRHSEISGLLRELIADENRTSEMSEHLLEAINAGNATEEGNLTILRQMRDILKNQDDDSNEQIAALEAIEDALTDDTAVADPTVGEATSETHVDESDSLISQTGDLTLTVETIMVDLHPANWDVPVITGRTWEYDIEFPVLNTSLNIDFNRFSEWIDLFREIMRWVWTLIFAFASIHAIRSAFV
ncbi:hypothetical protein [Rubellicoccus peritrichatus]|uniref:Uncharacterized protein n=1 Tax=Rubellicoccus peritrichatus TaxID=3080537 RepID=A0AAQ3LA24_9BACT|nr:hypothetical protein [Puniceicoccus sp. CR14]WOO39658.1 hypothetical protein RZN69_13625 [Puniceicoccus sp. CR14]